MNRMTNFALLMEMLAMTPRDVAARLNTDTTLVSRWRTGNRRIMPDRHWAREIADLFCLEDARRAKPVLPSLLLHFEADLDVDVSVSLPDAVRQFLTAPGQSQPAYHQRAVDLINDLMAGEIEPIQLSPAAEVGSERTAIGNRAARKLALDFVEEALKLCGSHEVLFFCPEGLSALTRDPKSARRLLDLMQKSYRGKGYITAVLCPDADALDNLAIFAAWTVAHLRGYAKSYYSDVFHAQDRRTMMGIVRGKKALTIALSEGSRVHKTNLYTDPDAVERLYLRVKNYMGDSAIGLHTGFLSAPDGYFRECRDFEREPCYLFARMPQFGLLSRAEYGPFYRLEADQVDRLWSNCAPLVQPVSELEDGQPVRHIYCQSTIEEALLEARRMLPAVSKLCGKRVFMTPQNLVDALKRIRALLMHRKHYDVCFLPQGASVDLSLQMVSWGRRCAVLWMDGRGSVAAKEPYIAEPIHAYCESLWDGIRPQLRSRAAALRQIDQWLKKAKLYGLKV